MGRAGVGGGECKESGYRAIRDFAISYEIRSILRAGNAGGGLRGLQIFTRVRAAEE
jgi:hypothetical protein